MGRCKRGRCRRGREERDEGGKGNRRGVSQGCTPQPRMSKMYQIFMISSLDSNSCFKFDFVFNVEFEFEFLFMYS